MILHDLLHKHYSLAKGGIGTFSFCEDRIPAPVGRVRVAFQPEFSGARWWGVPVHVFDDGEYLVNKMIDAGNAHQAMALLRRAYDEEQA